MQSGTEIAEEIETARDVLKSFAHAAVRAHFPETDENGNPSLTRFFLENGRLPFITDEIKPWTYRGWLIPYLQMAEAHPLVSKRYDYVMRTLDAGKLLAEPLPQIHFVGEFEQATKPGIKMLSKCLDHVEQKSGSWNGMREFCEWLGYALGVTCEQSKLKPEVQEFLYRNFNLEPLVLHPSDYLGQMLCETQHGKKNGFYPTPICIVQLMAQMVNAHKTGTDQRREATMDPCVGTGRMLLVASNYSMRLFGQDIDGLCCLITKINLALYAPWFYIPDSFFEEENHAPTELQLVPEMVEESKEIEFFPAQAAPKEISLFEKMRAEKEQKKRAKKYSTEIDNLPLFNLK